MSGHPAQASFQMPAESQLAPLQMQLPAASSRRSRSSPKGRQRPRQRGNLRQGTQDPPSDEKKGKKVVKIEDLKQWRWKESKALKAKFEQAMSGFKQVCHSIATDKAWDWAQNAELARLEAARQDLQSRLTEFHRQFLLTPRSRSSMPRPNVRRSLHLWLDCQSPQ